MSTPAPGNNVRLFFVASGVIATSLFVLFLVLGRWAPESEILLAGYEDGAIEYLGALFWALATIVCAFRLFTGQKPRLLLAFWMLASFIFFGEEISWFQRILGFETPEGVRELNSQGEFNFHNLESLSPLGLQMQNLFRLGFLAYFLVLPLVVTSSARARALAERVGYASPDRSFLVMVWGVIAASVILQLVGPDAALRATVEARESFFAFAVLVYVYLYLRETPETTATETPLVASD